MKLATSIIIDTTVRSFAVPVSASRRAVVRNALPAGVGVETRPWGARAARS